MKYFSIFILGLILYGCNYDNKPINTSNPISQLDSLMARVVRDDKFSGVVLIGNRDSIIYKNAWGMANRDWDIPLSADNQFDIASLNKSFIAVLTLLAEQDGKWKLNDPVYSYFKDGVDKELFNKNMTFHHLLTHTSGLADYNGVTDDLKKNNYQKFKRLNFTNAAYLNFIGQIETLNEPGKGFYYSNFGYHLLALLLEDAYGKSFNQLLQRKICGPLSLKNTVSYQLNTTVKKELATAYSYDAENDTWNSNQYIDLSLGRRIFSTAEDLYTWAKALDRGPVISGEIKRALLKNHLSGLNPELSYGYGLVIHDGIHDTAMGNLNLKKPYFIHGGSTEGYRSLMINVSGSELILILLTNSGDQTNELLLAESILKTINN